MIELKRTGKARLLSDFSVRFVCITVEAGERLTVENKFFAVLFENAAMNREAATLPEITD